jgi:hypothetical protein
METSVNLIELTSKQPNDHQGSIKLTYKNVLALFLKVSMPFLSDVGKYYLQGRFYIQNFV